MGCMPMKSRIFTPPILVNFGVIVFYVILAVIWQTKVLPAQRGLFSPFQDGLSFMKYLGLVVFINVSISLSSRSRNRLWTFVPPAATALLLLLSAFYLYNILKN